MLSLSLNAQIALKEIDLNPTGFSNPQNFLTVNGKLYFSADDGVHGEELWIYDSTMAAPAMFMDVDPGMVSSLPGSFIKYNNKLVFFAHTAGRDGMFITDGTIAGTEYLSTTICEKPLEYNGKLYLNGTIGTSSVGGFCVTDGTIAGTQKVASVIFPTPSITDGVQAVVMNGKMFFAGGDTTNGYELWTSDGTTAGTTLVKDIYPGKISGNPTHFTVVNNKLFFVAENSATGREVWISDGTAAGTQLLKDIFPGISGSQPQNFYAVGSLLYFQAIDPVNAAELWATDGTTSGTYLVKDINPTVSSAPYPLISRNGKLYFTATNNINGTELWATDGTSNGTYMIKDIDPGYKSGSPGYITTYNGNLYFLGSTNFQAGLWRLDNNDSLTLVKTLSTSYTTTLYVTNAIYNNRLYFLSDWKLFETDGTAANTVEVKPSGSVISTPCFNSTMHIYNSSLFFSANFKIESQQGKELWTLGTFPLTAQKLSYSLADITLYPNPAHHNFTIKTTTAFKAGSITLTDVTGRMVMTEKLYNNQQTIPLPGIAPGMYMADVWLDDRRSTQKLVIE